MLRKRVWITGSSLPDRAIGCCCSPSGVRTPMIFVTEGPHPPDCFIETTLLTHRIGSRKAQQIRSSQSCPMFTHHLTEAATGVIR